MSNVFHLTRVGHMSRAFIEPRGPLNRMYLHLRGYHWDTPWSPHLMSKARVWKSATDIALHRAKGRV